MAKRKKGRGEEREGQSMRGNVESSSSREDMVKWLTIGFVAVVFVGLVGFLVYNGKSGDTEESKVYEFSEISRTIEPRVEGDAATESAETAEVVELVEFADLQCPTCQAYHPTVKEFVEQNSNVRYVFKHFPLSGHQHARRAALAAEAAGEQGKFFEMIDLIFANQSSWSREANPSETFLGYARELELDEEQFQQDVESDELEERVNQNFNEGVEAGVGGTPTFFINGKRYPGLPQNSVEAFEVILESELENE